MNMRFTYEDAAFALNENDVEALGKVSEEVLRRVLAKEGRGSDFLGWVDLPGNVSDFDFGKIGKCVEHYSAKSDVVVVIGIGGSYLGARAVIEALQHAFAPYVKSKAPRVLYAGNNISEDYLHDLLEVLDGCDYSMVVISKSGTTTEPALAFRVIKDHCERKYGKEEAAGRIIAVTDGARGALKAMADKEHYPTFVIPDDVGGRYSVLTPVGLLPIAFAGFDIRELVRGARDMQNFVTENISFDKNPVLRYATVRNLLYKQGLKVELMASFEPQLFYFIEWYKQLFGESEGKENKGIFPAGAIFSTDLHSLGQYIQEGTRQLFETVIAVENCHHKVEIPFDGEDLDNLNYLQKRSINEINQIARKGTCLAHVEGKVPNMRVTIPEINEYNLGQLIYFFEISCAVSGYLLDVNPFDQPGVEAYKKNMFKLLGKPGVK
ncbi:MAG: glucose-6-phosphate isomerase [Bacteroidales bacterium]|nr:glucose-6-phosphate isomerase [Bacteroidales bacterium]